MIAPLKKLKAINEFPRPTNISELRSFEGMVNQMGNFSTEIAEASGVLRELRQKILEDKELRRMMRRTMPTWTMDLDQYFCEQPEGREAVSGAARGTEVIGVDHNHG